MANKIAEIDRVPEVYSFSGAYDLLAKGYVEHYEDFATVVPRLIDSIPGIRQTSTQLIFNVYG